MTTQPTLRDYLLDERLTSQNTTQYNMDGIDREESKMIISRELKKLRTRLGSELRLMRGEASNGFKGYSKDQKIDRVNEMIQYTEEILCEIGCFKSPQHRDSYFLKISNLVRKVYFPSYTPSAIGCRENKIKTRIH